MKKKIKVIIRFVMICFFCFGIYYSFNQEIFLVDKIDIQIKETFSGGDFFKKILAEKQKLLSDYRGQFLWSMNLEELFHEIKKDKNIKKAQVLRKFPNRLEVYLQPYEPALLYLTKKGKWLPVAKDGSLLPEFHEQIPLDLPVLRGNVFEKNKNLRKKIVSLMDSFPDESIAFSRKKVSEIFYDKKIGFTLTLMPYGMKVKMGVDGWLQRAKYIERVLNYLESEGLQSRVIDARFNKKVVVRLRNEP